MVRTSRRSGSSWMCFSASAVNSSNMSSGWKREDSTKSSGSNPSATSPSFTGRTCGGLGRDMARHPKRQIFFPWTMASLYSVSRLHEQVRIDLFRQPEVAELYFRDLFLFTLHYHFGEMLDAVGFLEFEKQEHVG